MTRQDNTIQEKTKQYITIHSLTYICGCNIILTIPCDPSHLRPDQLRMMTMDQTMRRSIRIPWLSPCISSIPPPKANAKAMANAKGKAKAKAMAKAKAKAKVKVKVKANVKVTDSGLLRFGMTFHTNASTRLIKTWPRPRPRSRSRPT